MTTRSILLGLFLLLLAGAAFGETRPSTAGASVQVLPPMRMAGLDRERTIRVYLPPSYAQGKRRYPVLYMHDGQNLFDDATSYIGEWGVDESMDALAKSDGIEVIVVGIDNGQDKRINELGPWPSERFGAGEGKQYMDFIVDTVKPYIDREFRTRPGRDDTGIMGSSLGGLISHYAAFEYPGVFGKVGIFSPSYWFAPQIYPFTAARHLKPGARLYLAIGDHEGDDALVSVQKMQDMAGQLRAAGEKRMTLVSVVRAGAEHNETFWKGEFPMAMRFLFGKR